MKQNNVLAFLVDKISAEAQADKNFEKYAKNVLTEGYQTGLLSTRLNDTEYEFIQDKIMSYMVADQKLKNVKALTRLIPTIALLIGALCKQISKGKLIKILSASLIMEIVIDAVMKNVLKLDLEELDPDGQLLCRLLMDGKSERQIAGQLGISQVAVNKRKQKVFALLREALDDWK